MAEDIKFGPAQQRLLNMLGDGKPHTRRELHNCCSVGRSNGSTKIITVDYHICILRKKLRALSVGKEYQLNIVPVEPSDESTFRMVKVFPAKVEDVVPVG